MRCPAVRSSRVEAMPWREVEMGVKLVGCFVAAIVQSRLLMIFSLQSQMPFLGPFLACGACCMWSTDRPTSRASTSVGCSAAPAMRCSSSRMLNAAMRVRARRLRTDGRKQGRMDEH